MAASTGTLVAAGLESAGYYAQSLVLSDLALLLTAVAVLLFVLLSARTLFSCVIQGNYIQALKLLVYPILVIFCLQTTTVSGGAEWQLGGMSYDRAALKDYVDQTTPATVSLPFELYNRFVSNLSQLGVGLILKNPVSSTVLFTTRQQSMQLVLNSEVISAGLRSLVHEGLQGKCGEWMSASRKLARGNRDPVYQGSPDYLNAVHTYEVKYGEASTVLQPTGAAYTYVLDMLNAVSASGPSRTDAEELVRSVCEGNNGVLPGEASGGKDVVDGPVSCAQIWCWSGLGLVIEARAALDQITTQVLEGNSAYKALAPESKAYFLQQILEDIVQKMSPDEEGTGFDKDPSSVLPVIIAGFLLKKELSRGPMSSVYSEFAESSGVGRSAERYSLTESDRSLLRESQSDYSLTTTAANEALSIAYSLPYLQGVLLFVLALLFPFFVIVSCFMRQGAGLVFWAGAWCWAKSWDIGWAIVMLVDNVLWELMPHRAIYVPVNKGIHSPITILESAFDTDPTYSLATYYLLLAMLMLSIPTITGQVLLRGASSISQILFGGIQQYGTSPAAALEQKKDEQRFEEYKLIAETPSTLSDPTVTPRELSGRRRAGLPPPVSQQRPASPRETGATDQNPVGNNRESPQGEVPPWSGNRQLPNTGQGGDGA